MRPPRQLLAGLVLGAVAAPLALSQPGPGQATKQVRLVIGNLVAANKTIGDFQGFGSALIRTELTRGLGRSHDIKLFTLLEKDQTFQFDEKIEDEERRGAALKPPTVARLAKSQINYFIFLTYVLVDGEHVRLDGQLAKVGPDRAYVVNSERTVVSRQDPELTTFGQKLYLDILNEEGVTAPRSYSLVFCNEHSDAEPAAEYVRSFVKSNLARDRPSLVNGIRGRTCTEGEAGPVDEILVYFRLVPKMGVEVELKCSDHVVAYGQLILVLFDQTLEDPNFQKRIDDLIQQIRGSWSPPL
jgi:hypothetical protein